MRSFDGFHFTVNHAKVNYTLIGALPTRGVFQVDGWGVTGFATRLSPGSAGGQAKHRSGRGIFPRLAPGPRPTTAPSALPPGDRGNIRMGTCGGHYVHVGVTGWHDRPDRHRRRTVALGALSHRAGWVTWKADYPGLAAPRSGRLFLGLGRRQRLRQPPRHVLPVAADGPPLRPLPFFNMMNNQDLFGMLIVRPHAAL
jgi:hypothetical protein